MWVALAHILEGKLHEEAVSVVASKHTVLFVDDEVNILSALKRLLRPEDMTVLCASRPREALEMLEHHAVQVVVTDQRMPEMSGIDLLARVRERHPQLVRMMLTGYTESQITRDAIQRGEIHRVMSKPWDDTELRTELRQAFQRVDLASADRVTVLPPRKSTARE